MKTNNLTYKTNKVYKGHKIFVSIRLNDECKNGHEDFAITATIYEAGKPLNDRNMIMGGCCHEEILKAYPEFKIFVDLHLADSTGAPMYAIENGYYHMTNLDNDNSKAITMDYLRISENEYNQIKDLDKLQFTCKLFSLGIVDRWKREADEAIKILEGLTGNEFESKATKKAVEPLKREELKELEIREKTGYYLPETIEQRKAKFKIDAANKIIKGLEADRDRVIQKANDEFNVKIFVLNSGLSIENFIYYNHTNKGVFNWLGYKPQIKKDDLLKLSNITENIPTGIIFELSTNK